MQKPFRRFELLLPTKFNNGLPVPDEPFADTLMERGGEVRGGILGKPDNCWTMAS
jgi:hypothetical protein